MSPSVPISFRDDDPCDQMIPLDPTRSHPSSSDPIRDQDEKARKRPPSSDNIRQQDDNR